MIWRLRSCGILMTYSSICRETRGPSSLTNSTSKSHGSMARSSSVPTKRSSMTRAFLTSLSWVRTERCRSATRIPTRSRRSRACSCISTETLSRIFWARIAFWVVRSAAIRLRLSKAALPCWLKASWETNPRNCRSALEALDSGDSASSISFGRIDESCRLSCCWAISRTAKRSSSSCSTQFWISCSEGGGLD